MSLSHALFNADSKSDPGHGATSALRKALWGPHYDGSPSAKEQIAMDDAEAGPDDPPPLPSETDPDILEAVKQDDAKARKRKGIASTLLGGDAGKPTTSPSSTLLGSSF